LAHYAAPVPGQLDDNAKLVASYDVRMNGAAAGDRLVVTFAVPPGTSTSTALPGGVVASTVPELRVLDARTGQYRMVPESMIQEVRDAQGNIRFFVVTFTDSTPISIFDLQGTVFAIVEVPQITFNFILLTQFPNDNAAAANEGLGVLLSRHQDDGGGSLVGVVTPTQVSVFGGGIDRDEDVAQGRQRRELMLMLEGLFGPFQNMLGQLPFIIGPLLVPAVEHAVPQTEPAPGDEMLRVPSSVDGDRDALDAAPSQERPQERVDTRNTDDIVDSRPTARLSARHSMSCLILAAILYLPATETTPKRSSKRRFWTRKKKLSRAGRKRS
jgi:hypothetical protein